MKLFEAKLTLESAYYDVKVTVPTTDFVEMLRTVPDSEQVDSYSIIQMFVTRNYSVTEQRCISPEIRDLLDIVGPTWVREQKIQAINLVKKCTPCSLLDTKNLVEGYLE